MFTHGTTSVDSLAAEELGSSSKIFRAKTPSLDRANFGRQEVPSFRVLRVLAPNDLFQIDDSYRHRLPAQAFAGGKSPFPNDQSVVWRHHNWM